MTRDWDEITGFYDGLSREGLAVGQMFRLADPIRHSSLASTLHGWTSMHDLCTTQFPVVYRRSPAVNSAKIRRGNRVSICGYP
jgi:hypothetical protein